MKNNKNFKYNKIFFIGIGGISMSGLCKISRVLGAQVLGSDTGINEEIGKLRCLGIKVYHGHDENNIAGDIDLVVYSGAISNDNVEIQMAKKLNIRCMERSQFLGEISRLFDNVIAISGTHGKTTTCAMVATILTHAKYNPTIHLGGESINLGDNTIIGDNKYLVVEACEYRESFRYLNPNILVVTNIDADHLDYYKDIGDITMAFQRLSNHSQFVIRHACEQISCSNGYLIDSDFNISNEKFENDRYTFSVNFRGKYFDTYTLNMIGRHNLKNALFAIAVCHKLGVGKDKIRTGLNIFAGVKRRYEKIGKINQVPVIIDYAHHPTEIKNSIAGVMEVYNRPLIIFQPHTYSRTLALMDDFVHALIGDVIIFATYPAREKEITGGRAIDLYNNIYNYRQKHNNYNTLKYCDNCDTLYNMLEKVACHGVDSVLILGAGDLAEKMRKYYK